jgi:hypothetical protein
MPYLYHGTGSRHVAAILRDGLRGRKPGQRANHPNVPSAPGRVYLSDTFALYHALDKLPQPALIRVDIERLDYRQFYPDEDWIATERNGDVDFNLIRDPKLLGRAAKVKAARQYALTRPDLAWQSLARHGTIAYVGTVPPDAIDGAVVFTRQQIAEAVMGGYDPVVGIPAHSILAERYRAYHAWAFGDIPAGQMVETGFHECRLPRFTPERIK